MVEQPLTRLAPLRPFARVAHKQDFKSATTGVAAKAMRNELNALVSGIDDPAVRKVRSD